MDKPATDKPAADVKGQIEFSKNKLNTLAYKIKAIVDQGRSISKNPSELYLYKGMYKELKPYFDAFNSIWDKLLQLTNDENIFPSKADKQLNLQVEKYYYEGCAIYEEYMNPTPFPQGSQANVTLSGNSSHNESRTVRARLPQINLPDFSGNPLEWPLFRDTYKSLIHEESTLSNMEKFLFLVSCLKGAAKSLISNISLTEANYLQAWNVLNEHFNDRRKLAHSYLKQILQFKPLSGKITSSSFKSLLTSVVESIDSFKNLSIPDSEDFILSFLVLRCLDPTTKLAFEKEYSKIEFPSYKNLVDFIKVEWKSRDLSYEESELHQSGNIRAQCSNLVQSQSSGSPRYNNRPRNSFFVGDTDKGKKTTFKGSNRQNGGARHLCPVCKANHTLYQCGDFRNSSPVKKIAYLKGWRGCMNCLSSGHVLDACNSLRRCVTCGGRHHSWLHQPENVEEAACQEVKDPQEASGITLGSICAQGDVLLGTAVVEAKHVQGTYHTIRLVTDSGSQYSFMTEDCAIRLGLQIEPSRQNICGIGQVHLNNIVGQSYCSIRSKIAHYAKELSTNFIIVKKITNDLPQVSCPTAIQRSYKSYVLADPHFYKPGPVELLLGGDLFYDIITGTPVVINSEIPRLLPTIFGFIVAGPLKSSTPMTEGTSFLVNSNQELNEIMRKFWEVEETSPVNLLSEDDEYCKRHFKDTHYRLDTGRYVVSLSVKDSISTLENPKGQAFKRLLNLEAKLNKNPDLKKEYYKFMKDYLELGHMTLASPNTTAYTIPHHPVVKLHDGQTKLRVVFEASCKSAGGSLNDHLYSGPKLQLDIQDILMNFRTYFVAVTADIVKMFRQILVHPADRKYQHILWRFDPSDSIKVYELCTVTQGVTCAPYAAEETIAQLVKDEGLPFPLASRALEEDMYVDDVVSGANSVAEAKELQQELIQLLAKGCFQLGKWASNSIELLESLNDDQRQLSAVSLSSDDEPKIKLLGMQWVPNKDIFTYAIVAPTRHPSKRAILSAIARIYDPLGFLAPVVFYAKVILQDMWIAQCGWDETGPPEISFKWHKFLDQLDSLRDIRIPRCINSEGTISYSIAAFSDASLRGYSAVIYLLSKTVDTCKISLLKAKTKLAPIKPMTIPRLELSGALLLSQLFKSCNKLIRKLNIKETYFFTDSEVVLGWLSTPPQKLNAFVAHRVIKILDLTDVTHWRHVSSAENPADCSSRGLLPAELPYHPLWWTGPNWLKLPTHQWPNPVIKADNLPEVKKVHATTLTTVQQIPNTIIQWMERFSSYTKLINSTAYIIRFVNRLRYKEMIQGPITLSEFRCARTFCIKISQEYHQIDEGHLKSLHAFTDEVGILRVGGRLQNSSLNDNAKHPVILSGKSHFSKLLVDHYHRSYLHLGSNALQSLLQTMYWIISARKLIRQRIFKCIKCYKTTRHPQAPLMGNLPVSRVQGGQVFAHVGVDFGGPFTIRESSRRKAVQGKCYLCLFICMATKAVHLEVVSKCSTDSFLACFDRFVARRGKPSNMYSDCGSNFIGAANKLKDIMLWLKSSQAQEELTNYATQQEILWSFNPPSSPHFGGIWEAGIKSAKTILKKIIGETPLTFEELTTIFCKIEGILNSRPITPLTSDPSSVECLTPGHFLVGRPLISAPEYNCLREHISPLKRWKLLQQYSQHFWTRWKQEYLHTLQQRRKWTSNVNNISIGDLVIVKDLDTSPRTWPLARVTETHPGADGVTRVVTIKTASGYYKRPVIKLVPLTPLNDN